MIHITTCDKNILCADCNDKSCTHAGDMVADCPVWAVGRSPECKGATSCDDCTWIKNYVQLMRQEGEKE